MTIGVAVWVTGGPDELVGRADAALYAGKAAGRDNVQLAAVNPEPGGGVISADEGSKPLARRRADQLDSRRWLIGAASVRQMRRRRPARSR